MRLILTIILFFAIYLKSAQAKVLDFKMKGIVLDSLSDGPIENASIQLFFENNLMKATLSKFDGSFSISVVENGNYILTISHVGYKTQNIPITISSSILPEIKVKLLLDELELKEVTVKANKPLVSQKNGEITYQIEGSIWQNSGNAMSIINRIPILKGRSGSAYLLYGTKVTFLVDGKPVESIGVGLEAILSNLGTGEIDKIEILQSPPPSLARFGRPIVNIKTLKQKENGSLLSLNHGFGRGKNNRFNNGIKYNLKWNNWLTGISFLQSQINQESKYTSQKLTENLSLNDNEIGNFSTNLYDLKFETELTTKKAGTLNLTLNHKNINQPNNAESIGNYLINNIKDNILLQRNTTSDSYQNFGSIDYSKKFSSIFNIKTTVDFGQFHIKNEDKFKLEQSVFKSNFTNPWVRKINFQNFYFENEAKLGAQKLTVGIINKSSESITNFIKNVGSQNTINSNFNYQENVFASFINSNVEKRKNSINAGLQLERTNVSGLNNLVENRLDFYSLLPSFSINHQINDLKSWNISYNRGINRPDYQWLNQQELYKNPYNKHIGGGVLQPTIYNKVTLTGILGNGLSLTGIYAHQKNRYSFFPFISPENIVNFSAINVKAFQYFYYSASYQKYLSQIWYFASNISGYYSQMKSDNYGIKNSGYTQQFSVSNYLTFKKLGQFGLTSSYNTTDFADSYQFLPQFSLNIEYSKSIFKKNGGLNISFSDITNSLKDRYVYKLANFSVKDNYKFETRLLKISVNYRIGNKNVKTAEPKSSKSETEIERLK